MTGSVDTPCVRCRRSFVRAAIARMSHCPDCLDEITQRKCRSCGISIRWHSRVCRDCARIRYLQTRYLSGGVLAQGIVASARRHGLLPNPKALRCVDCGGQAGEFDHRDYNEPLVVDAVCRCCNVRRGKAIPRRWAPGEWAEYVERCLAHSRARLSPGFPELRRLAA